MFFLHGKLASIVLETSPQRLCIISLLDFVYSNICIGKIVSGLFLDLSRAVINLIIILYLINGLIMG